MEQSGMKIRYLIRYILPAFIIIILFIILFWLIIPVTEQEAGLQKSEISWLIITSGGFSLIVIFLLMVIVHQGITAEKRRVQAEDELEQSLEKFNALVETSPEGTVIILEGSLVYANLIFLAMTGYTQDKIHTIPFEELFSNKKDPGFSLNGLMKILDEPGKTMSFEGQVKCFDNKPRDIIIMASSIKCFDKDGVILITKDITQKEKIGIEKESLSDELQSSLLMMNLPVTSVMKDPVKCDMNISIHEAGNLMSRQDQDAILITKDGRNCIGIITDTDLRNRVIAGDHTVSSQAYEIMSSPLVTISDKALLFEAILLANEKDISHLAVTGKGGNVIGIFSKKETVEVQQNSISFIIQEIYHAKTVDSLKLIHDKVPGLVKTLLDSGAKIQNITHTISTITDALTEQVIALAIEEMGKPPAEFAFVALGSEGRREQTLVTDQDNAIIYEDLPYDKMTEVNKYFLYLGQKINLWLDRIGFAYCKGEIMAGNPQWCQPVSRWKDYFTNWISNESEDSPIGLSVFFDFRTVYGEKQYVEDLRNHIDKLLNDQIHFYKILVDDTLKQKLPLNIFKSSPGDHSSTKFETLDLKSGIMPITDFSRIYSLYHRISDPNTLIRLEKIYQKGELHKQEYDEMVHSYSFLMEMRFKSQLASILNNEAPKNIISGEAITEIERNMIRTIFERVATCQNRLYSETKWN